MNNSPWQNGMTPPPRTNTPNVLHHCISILEERYDFCGEFIKESPEEFNFFIAQIYGLKKLQEHMKSIGNRLLSSHTARHHIQRTVHWLEKCFIPANITLKRQVADQVCIQVLERKIEAEGKARVKVKASEETAIALAIHAEQEIEGLEEEHNMVLKTADEVESRMDNKTKMKLQKNSKSGTQNGNVHPAEKIYKKIPTW
jgi:hypothetical protein